MIKAKKLFVLLIFFVFFSTYKPAFKERSENIFFPIKKIIIKNNKIIQKELLQLAFKDLYGKSIILIDKTTLDNAINQFPFISKIELKKKYPSTLNIIITEKTPIGIYFDKKEKIYISENGDFIPYEKIEQLENLPTIIGNKSKFYEFYSVLKNTDFPLDKIEKFHYFNIGRWDIIFKDGKTLKLPNKNLMKVLKDYILLESNKTFEKFSIIDYRINDQLILK